MEQGLGSSTWWEEAEYEQLGTANLRALFILDKLFKRDTAKFQTAWAVAFLDASCASPARFSPMRLPGVHGSRFYRAWEQLGRRPQTS